MRSQNPSCKHGKQAHYEFSKSAELAGRIYADLERAGQPIGRADPIIAAIAIERELVLSTGNQRHYQRIQELGYELRLINWKK